MTSNEILSYLYRAEHLSQNEEDFHFALRCNGYFLHKSGLWMFAPDSTPPLLDEFKGQRVSSLGPGWPGKFLFSTNAEHRPFVPAFKQQTVIDVIGKCRKINEDQAARIAFLLGGIVHHMASQAAHSDETTGRIVNAVEFAARMTMLGEWQDADAIASAMAMYVTSGGSRDADNHFKGNVNRMAQAVREDPIAPQETEDLGLSQVARLRSFSDNIQDKACQGLPEIAEFQTAFGGFPTVGAEFHIPLDAPKLPNFWERLAVVNMSQYQRGSYVPLSRNDGGVIEVRMNPSIYPITVANWYHLRLLLPELNRAFFTVTFNRDGKDGDFSWDNKKDKDLLNRLRTLGMLTYAGLFESAPRTEKPDEINFGEVYLGQTVKIYKGKYVFSGMWGGGEGEHGQLGIYTGFGDNFPYLAYYLSMALADHNILSRDLNTLPYRVITLGDVLTLKPSETRSIFNAIQKRVKTTRRLNKAFQSGNRIIELLRP